MYAKVDILLDQRNDVLTLPMTAIVRDGSGTYCCIVESGKIDRKKIELGLRSGGDVEVLSGLEPRPVGCAGQSGFLDSRTIGSGYRAAAVENLCRPVLKRALLQMLQEGVSLVVKPTSASYRGRPDREAERSVACA